MPGLALRLSASSPTPRHAAVIGAGLAGAAVCASLARLGWRLTLVDRAGGPAQAASALPVGMLSPHVTRAPTPLSRLSALGVASTRSELERLVPQGQGWSDCEVDNLGHDPGRWPAALVRPGALIQAWLAEARGSTEVDFRWNARVDHLRPDPNQPGWQLMGPQRECLVQADAVVVACAFDSLRMLRTTSPTTDAHTLPLRPIKGQMSLGILDGEPLAPRPQRNQGVFVPAYKDAGLPPHWPRRLWSMGSTYQRGADDTQLEDAAHAHNLERLRELSLPAAAHMQQALDSNTVLGWAQVRCASLDRLPLVGCAVDAGALAATISLGGPRRQSLALSDVPRCKGLYLLTALGSRGLTLAHWSAQLLASQMQEAIPHAPADLVRALDPARFAWRQARRQAR